MSARTHSTRILAIVALFFSSYIVGIYSAARASLQLAPPNATRSENSSLDALDATLSSETGLARSSSRNPRCKWKVKTYFFFWFCFFVSLLLLSDFRSKYMYVGQFLIITQCAFPC